MFSSRTALLVALTVPGALGCLPPAGVGGADESVGHADETVIDIGFFSSAYDGAEVCVEGACGVVGVDDFIVVRPVIVGPELFVEVSRGEAELAMERSFIWDVEALRLDPATVRTWRVAMGLVRSSDGSCAVYLTNHELENWIASSTIFGPDAGALCGPFAGE